MLRRACVLLAFAASAGCEAVLGLSSSKDAGDTPPGADATCATSASSSAAVPSSRDADANSGPGTDTDGRDDARADALAVEEAGDAIAAAPPVRAGLPAPLAYWPLDARDFVSPHVMKARIGGPD